MLETEKRDIVWCCSKWKSALPDLGSFLFHVSTSSGPAGRSRDFSHSAPSIRRHTVDVDGDGGIARPRKEGPGLSLRQLPSPCRAVVLQPSTASYSESSTPDLRCDADRSTAISPWSDVVGFGSRRPSPRPRLGEFVVSHQGCLVCV